MPTFIGNIVGRRIKHNIIITLVDKIRHLKGVLAFKVSAKLLVVFLMVLGAWVATRSFDVPLGFAFSDKFKHVIVFMGFAFFIDLAVSRKPFWLWKALPLMLYGLGIEVLQYFSPDRTFSLWDWLADVFGILLYLMIKFFTYKIISRIGARKGTF